MIAADWIRSTRRRVVSAILAAALLASSVTWTAVLVYQPDPFGVRAAEAAQVSRTELAVFACSIVETNEGRARILRAVPDQEREAERATQAAVLLRELIAERLGVPCGPPGRATEIDP